jgi:uncharacterized protein DUF4167
VKRINRRIKTRLTFNKMRSSKSRSRSKSNRNRQSGGGGGNVVNRVFDSSGPEGKVRGTPQQIIDKYNQLSRDAHLSNDRVAVENFQQHAEHYLRLLSVAQREQDARREEQERQNRERQADRDRERAERVERQERVSNGPPGTPEAASATPDNQDPGAAPQPDVLDLGSDGGDGGSGLVETPEGAPKKPSRRPRGRKPADKPQDNPAAAPSGPSAGKDDTTPEAAE